jgi:hypothetical protein
MSHEGDSEQVYGRLPYRSELAQEGHRLAYLHRSTTFEVLPYSDKAVASNFKHLIESASISLQGIQDDSTPIEEGANGQERVCGWRWRIVRG